MEKFIKTGCIICMLFLIGALIFQAAGSQILVSANASGKELPIYCVETDNPQIALSFDAAWGADDTSIILEILETHGVKATFFMTGDWVSSYPEEVKAIAAAGHDLGNHSENHKHMTELSDSECQSELMSVHEKVKELTGVDMFLFRPPYGDYDKNYGVQSIVDTVLNHKNLGNGSIILCHNGADHTAEALDGLITGLKEKGYEFVPISQLIIKDHYHIDFTGRQIPDSDS